MTQHEKADKICKELADRNKRIAEWIKHETEQEKKQPGKQIEGLDEKFETFEKNVEFQKDLAEKDLKGVDDNLYQERMESIQKQEEHINKARNDRNDKNGHDGHDEHDDHDDRENVSGREREPIDKEQPTKSKQEQSQEKEQKTSEIKHNHGNNIKEEKYNEEQEEIDKQKNEEKEQDYERER